MSSISVVIPTHDRRRSLIRTLAALAGQAPVAPDEVIVVCDGCTDGSAQAVRGLGMPYAVRVLEQPQSGPAVARNAGVEAARHEVVVFIDDDVVPEPGFLAAHWTVHADDPQAVVIGPLLAPAGWGQPWIRWEMRTVVRQYGLMEAGDFRPGPRQLYTGNASVRRRHLVAAGGFDPAFRRAEDVELGFRLQAAGLRFVFQPRAAAEHLAERSFESWLSAARQYGRNDVVLGRARNRPDMLSAIAREYHERHPLTRLAAWAALTLPELPRPATRGVRTAALAAQRLGLDAVAHAACAAGFSYQYWLGVAEEVGGRGATRALIAAHAP